MMAAGTYFATIPLITFSVGVEVGSVYTTLLQTALSGDVLTVILDLFFFTLCILNPIIGYVPKFVRQYDQLITTAGLLIAYTYPPFAIIPLGLIVAVDAVTSTLSEMDPLDVPTTRMMGLAGFLVGRNVWITDYIDFLCMLGPVVVLINALSDVRQSDRVYSKRDLLACMPDTSEVPRELASLKLVPIYPAGPVREKSRRAPHGA